MLNSQERLPQPWLSMSNLATSKNKAIYEWLKCTSAINRPRKLSQNDRTTAVSPQSLQEYLKFPYYKPCGKKNVLKIPFLNYFHECKTLTTAENTLKETSINSGRTDSFLFRYSDHGNNSHWFVSFICNLSGVKNWQGRVTKSSVRLSATQATFTCNKNKVQNSELFLFITRSL